MARTKRKTNPVIPAAEAPAQAQKRYRTAAYARLSVEDSGKRDLHWDAVWCSLNADINEAETEQLITPEQAAHLRTKYLRMEERND